MSSNKAKKWSTASSLTKILTRISRTFSFSSKKSQGTLKNNTKKIRPIEPVIKVNFAPQSAPILRRQQPRQPISPPLFYQKSKDENSFKPMMYKNMYVESDIEEDDYLFRPNLSLLNISVDNLYSQSLESFQQEHHCLDDVFHSTKIEDY